MTPDDKEKHPNSKIRGITGLSIVVANMIGTGVFTTLGFQLEKLHDTAAVLTLWVFGGVLALAGALSYAEVGTRIRKSGGEYTFLSRLYHPVVGYLSGWISLTVGFAAPVALAAIAAIDYFPLPVPCPRVLAIALLAVVTALHCRNLKVSARFQNLFTAFKIALVAAILGVGLFIPSSGGSPVRFGPDYLPEIASTAFAVCLIYVSYAYSGWNAAAYITEEFRNPARALPVALIGGTLLVTVLYTLLQYVFLKHVPATELAGHLNVGTIVMERVVGAKAVTLFSGAITLLLLSGISAMVWIGSRVTASIAAEHGLWRFLRQKREGVPVKALVFQGMISALLIATGTFEQIMVYCGILLSVSSLLVVGGVFIVRRGEREAGTFRSPLFPLFQVIFIAASLWMITFAVINETRETLLGLLNVALGLITYKISKLKHETG
ncbi:MAG: amino acid permease [Odoribacteraceae bacterium]|jgi:APA family basic amino acid/polyamine antiporter|nr:amino acid permease [Odoribacteraceae bacterium]